MERHDARAYSAFLLFVGLVILFLMFLATVFAIIGYAAKKGDQDSHRGFPVTLGPRFCVESGFHISGGFTPNEPDSRRRTLG